MIPAKAADESMIRLLLADRQQGSLPVYIDGFRAYEPLEDDAFGRGTSSMATVNTPMRRCTPTAARTTRDVTVALVSSGNLQGQADAVSQSVPAPPGTIPKIGARPFHTRCPGDTLKSAMCYPRTLVELRTDETAAEI